MYINKYIYIYTYIYTYTYIYIYTFIYIYKSVRVHLFIFPCFRSVLKLAKMFLDPLDNESYGGKYGISINVGTLLHETNIASERCMTRPLSPEVLPSLVVVAAAAVVFLFFLSTGSRSMWARCCMRQTSPPKGA